MSMLDMLHIRVPFSRPCAAESASHCCPSVIEFGVSWAVRGDVWEGERRWMKRRLKERKRSEILNQEPQLQTCLLDRYWPDNVLLYPSILKRELLRKIPQRNSRLDDSMCLAAKAQLNSLWVCELSSVFLFPPLLLLWALVGHSR